MEFDIAIVPFSRFGSYMALNVVPPHWHLEGLILRTMRGVGASREVARVSLVRDGQELSHRLVATPTLLRMEAEGCAAELCSPRPDVLRLRARGAELRLTMLQHKGLDGFPAGSGRWHVNCPANRAQYLLSALKGSVTFQQEAESRKAERPGAARFLPGPDGVAEGTVQEFATSPETVELEETFEASLAHVEQEWAAWLKKTPQLPPRYSGAAELAMYVNWSAVVAPSGAIRRPTMLMSKNWMTQCWSWDHCFNAIALSYRDPDLAWDQLMTLFDHQDERGALPDAISYRGAFWNYCKPPIHGWALTKMMKRRGLLTNARLREIYGPLARWTEWWLRDRDYDGDGLPEYHHGNDSGWDNATVFDGGFPATAPDLAAYLVVQMDVLAVLAQRLGRAKQAGQWRERADALLKNMLERLWTGDQFVTRRAFSDEVFPKGDCLLNHLAIVAGKRLPQAIRARVAEAVKPDGRFVTPYGPATESPQSPLYEPDGYWRGPIWGSSTVLLVDGLARAGYPEQAREIARRYCDMCLQSGFAENYDALTGRPLRDKAYTWGSSAYLILAHEFLR